MVGTKAMEGSDFSRSRNAWVVEIICMNDHKKALTAEDAEDAEEIKTFKMGGCFLNPTKSNKLRQLFAWLALRFSSASSASSAVKN
jgi:hypothetical protein